MIKYFLERRLSSEKQQKWVTKMIGYKFEDIYNKGKQILVADALARKGLEYTKGLLYVISTL